MYRLLQLFLVPNMQVIERILCGSSREPMAAQNARKARNLRDMALLFRTCLENHFDVRDRCATTLYVQEHSKRHQRIMPVQEPDGAHHVPLCALQD